DDHRLAEDLLHLRLDAARDEVEVAARREGHDEPDRPVGVGLRLDGERHGEEQDRQESLHCLSASGLTRLSGRSPASMRSISLAAATLARARACWVTAARCGVRITLSSARSGWSGARR